MPTCIHLNTAGINQMRYSYEQSSCLICMCGGAGAAALITLETPHLPWTQWPRLCVIRSSIDREGTGALNLINHPEADIRRQGRSSETKLLSARKPRNHDCCVIEVKVGGGGRVWWSEMSLCVYTERCCTCGKYLKCGVFKEITATLKSARLGGFTTRKQDSG